MTGSRNKDDRSAAGKAGDLAPGGVLWLLGPTSAGKTTLATRVVADLRRQGIPSILFDGDEVRGFFGPHLGFDVQSRMRVVTILAHLANKSVEAGLQVVVAALTAGEEARRYIRANVTNLKIGYVACSIETCAQRDPKGLYHRAMLGEIDTLIGYNSEYSAPPDPDLVLDTETHSLDELASRIVRCYVASKTGADVFGDAAPWAA
jgi:adenylylsulfate kinase